MNLNYFVLFSICKCYCFRLTTICDYKKQRKDIQFMYNKSGY